MTGCDKCHEGEKPETYKAMTEGSWASDFRNGDGEVTLEPRGQETVTWRCWEVDSRFGEGPAHVRSCEHIFFLRVTQTAGEQAAHLWEMCHLWKWNGGSPMALVTLGKYGHQNVIVTPERLVNVLLNDRTVLALYFGSFWIAALEAIFQCGTPRPPSPVLLGVYSTHQLDAHP